MATKTKRNRKPTSRVTKTRAKAADARQTKADTILGLLQRPTGASIGELTKATGWQPHSVRAALTGEGEAWFDDLLLAAVDATPEASGGAGTPEDLYQALVLGNADAVLAASIFHYGTYSIADTKAYLAKRGILIRV